MSPKTFSIFQGPLRCGSWGNWTRKSHEVLLCRNCTTGFLRDVCYDHDYYKTEKYRKNYNDNFSIKSVKTQHCEDDQFFFDRIGPATFQKKAVADIGAGAGGLLDLIQPLAKNTIAVEPAKASHSHLSQTHMLFPYIDALKESGQKVDVITSVNVIEHLSQPGQFIGEMCDCLNQGGKLILITPNFDDILFKYLPDDFGRYFFRTAHLYYFSKKSIETMLSRVKFKNISIEFIHKYSLDNLLNWLKNRQPGGRELEGFETAALNNNYISEIENQGLASHMLIRCEI